MDGRDSSAAAGEDDKTSPVTDGLAKEAEALFSSGKFSECIDVLNQLLLKKEGDPKVLHNIAVAECFHDGCSDPRKLLDMLKMVKKRSEELARSSKEQVESSGNLGSNSTSGSKGSGTNPNQLSSTDSNSVAYIDEFDTSIITLNTAIVLYHLREYPQALSILEPLYQNLDPIDAATALHVCLLLLDILLASQDASKAAEVIQYVEKSFSVGYLANQSDNNGNPTQHQSLIQGPKPSTRSHNSVLEPSSADINDIPLSGTLSDDAQEYENLYSTLDGSGQNFGRPRSSDHAKASLHNASELKLKMHLYKVRLLILTRNLKAAKREVKLAMNMAWGKDSSAELLLKSQLVYASGNHEKAIKLLNTSSNPAEPEMLSICNNNNLGCIHFRLGAPHTSGYFFSKALKDSKPFRSEKSMNLSTFAKDKSLFIMYNCGVQHLACEKPVLAAKCFGKASLIFYNQPLLWLRIAESCLLAFEKGILKSNGESIRVHVIGTGKWRQLVVDDLSSRNGYDRGENGDQYQLSLPFARYCLMNALLLLIKTEQKASKSSAPVAAIEEEDSFKSSDHKNTSAGDSKIPNTNGDSKENKGGILSSYLTLQSSVIAYEEIQREENHMIKQSVLGALAFVELYLENPQKALSFAKSLLNLPECSKISLFLGHIYAAEALCHLNRSKEAAEHLSVYLTDAGSIDLPFSSEDREKWNMKKGGAGDNEDLNSSKPQESQGSMPLKPEEARGVALLNFSTVFAMQGEIEKARKFATEAQSLLPKEPRALLASVYIDLLQDRKQEVLSKLRKLDHVTYLSTDVKLSS